MAERTANEEAIEAPTQGEHDLYELYVRGVQNPDDVARFTNELFQKKKQRLPKTIREDFCGTAINCLQWLESVPEGKAAGVDLDPEPLKWAEEHLSFPDPSNLRKALDLLEGDALEVKSEPSDVLLSLNSSICYFHEREQLLDYLNACYQRLTEDGLLILELYGGPDARSSGSDRIPFEDFTLIWDQASFNTLTQRAINHIHFEFPDGSRINRAFSYNFRLWSIAELLDLLKETAFQDAEIYSISDDSYTKYPDTLEPVEAMEEPGSFTAYVVCS